MQLERRKRPKRPGGDGLQRSARAVVGGFAVDARTARQIILEAVDAGAKHCGPLAVSTLCAMLSGKYAPASEDGARAAAERVFSPLPEGEEGARPARDGKVRGYGLSGEVPTPSPSQASLGPLPLPWGEGGAQAKLGRVRA